MQRSFLRHLVSKAWILFPEPANRVREGEELRHGSKPVAAVRSDHIYRPTTSFPAPLKGEQDSVALLSHFMNECMNIFFFINDASQFPHKIVCDHSAKCPHRLKIH